MKLTIKTDIFKEMVSKATKGASCNKIIPITSMMSIELSKGVLTLTTSDASNYLYVRHDKIVGEDFYVTVPVETFSKLISRMTCEQITLELTDRSLKVSGNGNYLIELPEDENGELIKYPNPLASVADPVSVGEIHNTTIQTILNTLKPALAVTLEVPCYTGYYVGDKAIATDTSKMAVLNTKIFDSNFLISPEMMNLVGLITSEKISVDSQGEILIFSSPECVVYGPIMEDIESFNEEAVSELVNSSIDSKCKLSKTSLMQLLDRLILFVSEFDDNAVTLTFTKDGMMIKSKSLSGEELIPYVESENFKEFVCDVDVKDLTTMVKSNASDGVELYYGHDNILKTVDGNVVQAICLLQEVEMEE